MMDGKQMAQQKTAWEGVATWFEICVFCQFCDCRDVCESTICVSQGQRLGSSEIPLYCSLKKKKHDMETKSP